MNLGFVCHHMIANCDGKHGETLPVHAKAKNTATLLSTWFDFTLTKAGREVGGTAGGRRRNGGYGAIVIGDWTAT